MKIREITVVAVLLSAFLYGSATAQPAEPRLTVQVEHGRVRASGGTRGKEILFYSIGRKATGFNARIVKVSAVVADTDHDGNVELEAETPLRSVWLAVDLQTAHYGIGVPEGYEAVPSALVRGFGKKSGDLVDLLTVDGRTAGALYVHPGGRAWTFSAIDGGPGDGDGAADGSIVMSLADAKPLSLAELPESAGREFVPGGLLFVIAPDTLLLSVGKLTGAQLGGGR